MLNSYFNRLILTIIFLVTTQVMGQKNPGFFPKDHRVKAAFLVKFIKYVNWKGSKKGTFRMGVFGDSAIAGNLFALMPKKIGGWKIDVTKIQSVEDSLDCKLVFISSSQKEKYQEIINALKGSSVLTVSDTSDFLNIGGMINFVVVDQMIRFEINLKAAEEVGLKISSKLLRLAKDVYK